MSDRSKTKSDRTKQKVRSAPLQVTVLVIALVYLVLGIAGLFVPGNAGSTPTGAFGVHAPQYVLWIFSVSPIMNIMHILVGVLGLPSARDVGGVAIYSLTAAIWFAAISAYSILVLTVGTGDRINLNWADVVLHLVTMAVAAVLAYLGFRTIRRRGAESRA